MPKTKSKSKPEIPPDVLEAIDEAAVDIAAETSLSKAQAREMLLKRMQAKADASVEDVEDAADEIEDEDEDKSKGKGKGKSKGKEKDEDEDTEDSKDGDEDEDEDEDEDTKDEKPPPTHWSSRPLFGSGK